MAKKVFGSFLIMLFSILSFLFFKTGAYKSVVVEEAQAPNFQMFYVEHVGPYHEIIDSLSYVETEFQKLKHPCKKTFGHFLSDPEIIEHEKLVSHTGCVFDIQNSPQLLTLPDRVQQKVFKSDLNTRPKCFKGSFKGSPSLSALKVYPKLKALADKERIKVSQDYLEVYTVEKSSVLTEVYLCEEAS